MQRLMRKMGNAALGPKPSTTAPAVGHKDITPFAAECADRSAEPGFRRPTSLHSDWMRFLYVAAIMDWSSCAGLYWRLSNTMDVLFCVSVLKEALRFDTPEI